jgi:phosphatidylglycerophosphate synthase
MQYAQFMEKTRNWRTKKLYKVGKFLLKIKLTPNILTTFSLMCGIAAIYFLFNNYLWFTIFAVLHLFFDAIDGVAARASKSTLFGSYYDHITDSLITLLAICKIGIFYGDYYAFMVAGLFFLTQCVYYFSAQRAPALFTRTMTIIMLIFYAPGTFFESSWVLVLNYLSNGVAAAYSLAKQLQCLVKK